MNLRNSTRRFRLPQVRLWRPFKRLGTTTRIAFAMAMWSASVLLCLRLAGVLEDGHETALKHRTGLCETLAIHCSQGVSTESAESTQVLLQSVRNRHPDILSIGYRLANGELQHTIGPHEDLWGDEQRREQASLNRIIVPVYDGAELHAHIETAFEPPVQHGFLGFLALPSVQITALAALLNFLGFSIWLRRCFKHLDPSQVVPERVRSALDTMAEVILVVDNQNRIMLVNHRLTEVLGEEPDRYQGRVLKSLPWEDDIDQVIAKASADAETKVVLSDKDKRRRVYKLNQNPIIDDAGQSRGRIISLDDITQIEEQSDELRATMEDLKKSQAEIAEQNERLQYLATRDPMTGCFNRRSFFESFGTIWKGASRYDHPVSCIMVDVDHFKSINDNHGHAMGDEVLKCVASSLLETARDSDIVCRYGGEEFCVLLPHVDIEGARLAGERFRSAIAALEFPELSVTASLGCSDRSQGASSAEAMLEQADQALYSAKRGGRNRVVTFCELAATTEEAGAASGQEEISDESPVSCDETELESQILEHVESLQADAQVETPSEDSDAASPLEARGNPAEANS